jgi:TonB family protein
MTSSATREYAMQSDSGLPPRTPRAPRTRQREQFTFGLLPEPEGRNKAFTASLIINASAIALVLIMSIFFVHHEVVQKQMEATQLLVPIQQVKPMRPIVRPKVQVTPPTPDLLNRIAPKFTYRPSPAEDAPRPARVHMNNVSAPVLPPYRPDSVALPPQPKVGAFQASVPTAVANNASHATTKTGGFGDPMGVHADPNANRPATVAAYGSFQSAPGVGSGAGAARRGSVHGVDFGSGYANGVPGGAGRGAKVATTGFGNGVIGGAGPGHPHGTVKQAGFANNLTAAGTPQIATTRTPNETGVQVLSYPRPEYTAEAKQLKIQGDVVLEVRFSADGRCQVLRVVRGLGHGLDQQAIRAAEATRFKPATRDGKPVDVTTLFHVDFQLA